MYCTIYVAKTKVLICCAVTAQLICNFVFAYAKAGFLMRRLISVTDLIMGYFFHGDKSSRHPLVQYLFTVRYEL